MRNFSPDSWRVGCGARLGAGPEVFPALLEERLRQLAHGVAALKCFDLGKINTPVERITGLALIATGLARRIEQAVAAVDGGIEAGVESALRAIGATPLDTVMITVETPILRRLERLFTVGDTVLGVSFRGANAGTRAGVRHRHGGEQKSGGGEQHELGSTAHHGEHPPASDMPPVAHAVNDK